jgi:hypothetical protein
MPKCLTCKKEIKQHKYGKRKKYCSDLCQRAGNFNSTFRTISNHLKTVEKEADIVIMKVERAMRLSKEWIIFNESFK